MGTYRPSMRTNVLLTKSELGKVKPSTFPDKNEDRVFGAPNLRDAEGARDVTMVWKQHKPNPDDKPGPDFKKMNKKAAIRGLTSAPEQHLHRTTNYAYLKKGQAVIQAAPKLPSDVDVEHTYGLPSTYVPLEVYRVAGDPANVKNLIQNSYANDWIEMNKGRGADGTVRASGTNYKGVQTTRACEGHAFGAHYKYLMPQDQGEPFKMSKFKNIPPKTDTYRLQQ